jgi:cellulose biosynthesis protein BcsQ
MSIDTYLIISLAAATVLLITMQPAAWVLWGLLLVTAGLRLGVLIVRLLN